MDAKNKNLTVTQSNHLIEASYRLKLDEKRLILAAVSKIDSRNQVPDEITVTAEEYGSMFDLDKTNAYRQLDQATMHLYERDIKLIEPDKQKRTHLRWVQAVEYHDGEGCVTLEFTDRVKPYLGNIKSHFTSYKLIEVKSFSSGHAIRLYELLMQFRKTGIREVEVPWLKAYFGVENRYPRFGNFRQFSNIYVPLVAEILRPDIGFSYIGQSRERDHCRIREVTTCQPSHNISVCEA